MQSEIILPVHTNDITELGLGELEGKVGISGNRRRKVTRDDQFPVMQQPKFRDEMGRNQLTGLVIATSTSFHRVLDQNPNQRAFPGPSGPDLYRRHRSLI